MPIQTVVRDVCSTALVPPMQVLVTRVNRRLVQLVPVDFCGFSVKERLLILNRIPIERLMLRIDKIIGANLVRIANILIDCSRSYSRSGARILPRLLGRACFYGRRCTSFALLLGRWRFLLRCLLFRLWSASC